MKRRSLALMVFLLLVAPIAADVPEELKPLQGQWQAQKAQREGQDAPADVVEKLRVLIDGTKIILDDGSAREERGEVSVDPTKQPATIDIKPTGQGRDVVKGIFKLEGDTLTLCWTKEGDRPAEFASKGVESVLLVLKRVKK